jgi:geranylgeranyl diphosphate synthase type II
VHAMSLIHDDLPCMDDDDYRRGQPANHKVFGEATALLAGDGLLVYVFELLVKELRGRIPSDILLTIVEEFAHALGPDGMVAGQSEDLALTGSTSDATDTASNAEALQSMHSKKTGALISFSAWAGATISGAQPAVSDAFKQYGEVLGLAFQITDDLLDVTGDIKDLGKTPGKDQAARKTTWVSVWGMEQSREYLSALQNKADSILSNTGIKTDSLLPLKSLLQYAIERHN